MKNLWILFAIVILFSCDDKETPVKVEDPLSAHYDSSMEPFYHGVASGDPLTDAVIIWTKVTPEDSLESLTVNWEMSTTENFENSVQEGEFTTDPGRDYTVKVDVTGLKPDMQYFYRFAYDGKQSVTGKTKTAPLEDLDSLKFAVVSCSNYEWGYFNAYASLAKRNDISAVLHLGDYIYEYGPGGYGDTTMQRIHYPDHEIVSLEDYRNRYAQYRLDKDLQAVHQNLPFITIWDDHEVANNSYVSGAQNHQEEEGDYNTRKANAKKAYYEWLPVREGKELYRSFEYGDLAKVIMLDERLAGRTAPVDSVTDPHYMDTTRYMLGSEQLDWFLSELVNTDAKWKVIGNQVIFSYLNWGHSSFSLNMDSWDGYPVERAKIIDFIQSNGLDNVVFVTGDTHSSWALEVTDDPFEAYSELGAVAVEFGTTSINSANSNERYPTDTVRLHEQKIVGEPLNPQLKYANLRDHGYMEIVLTEDGTEAIWHYVKTVKEKSDSIYIGKKLYVIDGMNRIIESPEGDEMMTMN